jgi:hypothetical protein
MAAASKIPGYFPVKRFGSRFRSGKIPGLTAGKHLDKDLKNLPYCR